MKNVLIFSYFENNCKYELDLLHRYLSAQIDNSLHFGWKESDLIVATNFPFFYRNVSAVPLYNNRDKNVYFNKWYGMSELLGHNMIMEDFWFHDHDCWQINDLEFPAFDNHIGICPYIFNGQWNTASLFVKYDQATMIMDRISFTMMAHEKMNRSSDEDVVALNRNAWSDVFSELNTQYNVGWTEMQTRLDAANKPVKIIGFKPHVQRDYDRMKEGGLVDGRLDEIFKKHDLRYND